MVGATASGAVLARWLVAPATGEVRREQAVAAAFLRVVLGLMWLYNVAWKRPPGFESLEHFIAFAVSHPVLPPFSLVVEKVVLPNIAIFGWGVLIVESALAVMLLTGAWVRVAAALGAIQSLAIGLSVALAPDEWPWAYILMIAAHVAVLFSSAGRVFAVDAVRSGVGPAPRLARQWGAIAVVTGVAGALGSAGDPLARSGFGLGSSALEVGLGEYNLLGGLVLVLAGGLLLASARGGNVLLGRAAAAVGAVAALSLYAQVGFTGPFLGGTATSAAFLVCIALVAAMTGGAPSRPVPDRAAETPETPSPPG
ncbi:MAG: hypothetical protein GEV11_14515 [Streptosporangiales bacterium]|nr:hypothetical protein [Streptosporangiales bacterium]